EGVVELYRLSPYRLASDVSDQCVLEVVERVLPKVGLQEHWFAGLTRFAAQAVPYVLSLQVHELEEPITIGRYQIPEIRLVVQAERGRGLVQFIVQPPDTVGAQLAVF